MPVYSGAIQDSEGHLHSDMEFSECIHCKSVQLKKLVDPNLVYMIDHNSLIVGDTWKNHYIEFFNFIGDLKSKTVLELSDPSAKLAKMTDIYNRWLIVEPNSYFESTDKIIFIPKFFDENFDLIGKVDFIVHSHFFEHTFEPLKILEKCHQILDNDGDMIFSVPNLQYLLENGYQPNNILHFEHTFYYDEERMEYLLNRSGFEIIDVKKYRTHSIFYKCKKTKNSFPINNFEFSEDRTQFESIYNGFIEKIRNINSIVENFENIFLFGCHSSTQFLISNGLDITKINSIIDNSSSKQGKYLYGTNMVTKSPEVIKNLSNVLVIVNHASIYAEEIKKSILDLKKDIEFI